MDTPICDFLQQYAQRQPTRLHMPGHKGRGDLGVEQWDITEIEGADALFEAKGIIAQSEANATALFGTQRTLYSTEGSSLCVRAMVALCTLYARNKGVRPLVLAARNAHRSFVSALGLCHCDVQWLYAKKGQDDMACPIGADLLAATLDAMETKPIAVYLTSPDYLGHVAPIGALARVCHIRDVLLVVDNAHGAYLHFAATHPMDEGADMCCDSAHKTLPALTCCAYLHIGKNAPAFLAQNAKWAMSRFATSSPSYLQLMSLDGLNPYLETYAPIATAYADKVACTKSRLQEAGYTLVGEEPYKLTLDAPPYGYTGHEIARYLAKNGFVCEMDTDRYVVAMLSPSLPQQALSGLTEVLLALPPKEALPTPPAAVCHPEVVLPVYEAMWAPFDTLEMQAALGRVVADVTLPCPPAVPVVVPGERIDQDVICALARMGVTEIRVVK